MAIRSVLVWDNGMVMVFDERGEQVPEYQGRLDEVGEHLARVFPRERWEHLTWSADKQRVMGDGGEDR